MDLKLLKMLCKDSKQHHVIFHELYSVSSLLCIAQNVSFEIPYKVLYFKTPFLMIFKYYAWVSYGATHYLGRLAPWRWPHRNRNNLLPLTALLFNGTNQIVRFPRPELGRRHKVLWEIVSGPILTCDQALFSFRSAKHSGGKGKKEKNKRTPDRRLALF